MLLFAPYALSPRRYGDTCFFSFVVSGLIPTAAVASEFYPYMLPDDAAFDLTITKSRPKLYLRIDFLGAWTNPLSDAASASTPGTSSGVRATVHPSVQVLVNGNEVWTLEKELGGEYDGKSEPGQRVVVVEIGGEEEIKGEGVLNLLAVLWKAGREGGDGGVTADGLKLRWQAVEAKSMAAQRVGGNGGHTWA